MFSWYFIHDTNWLCKKYETYNLVHLLNMRSNLRSLQHPGFDSWNMIQTFRAQTCSIVEIHPRGLCQGQMNGLLFHNLLQCPGGLLLLRSALQLSVVRQHNMIEVIKILFSIKDNNISSRAQKQARLERQRFSSLRNLISLPKISNFWVWKSLVSSERACFCALLLILLELQGRKVRCLSSTAMSSRLTGTTGLWIDAESRCVILSIITMVETWTRKRTNSRCWWVTKFAFMRLTKCIVWETIDATYVTVLGTGHFPLFFLSIIRTTTPAVIYLLVCMLMSVTRPSFCIFHCDRCSNHANKNCPFCLQYPLSSVCLNVSLLPFLLYILFLCYRFAITVAVKSSNTTI